MGDPCKLIITQETGLCSNKTMKQKHETCPQTIRQWWNETHTLPSDVSKLTTPKHALYTHKKNNNLGKVTFQSERLSLNRFEIIFPQHHDSPGWATQGQKLPYPTHWES